MTGDPADICETPVGVFRMNILVALRRAGHVGQLPTSAVLASLGLSRRAAGIHEEERCLCWHGHGVDGGSTKLLQEMVHEVVSTFDDRCRRRILARIPAPNQDF